MKKSIKELTKDYLKSKRRWVSHQELESLSVKFNCCGSTIMRKLREMHGTDPDIYRKLVNGVVYYKYQRFI